MSDSRVPEVKDSKEAKEVKHHQDDTSKKDESDGEYPDSDTSDDDGEYDKNADSSSDDEDNKELLDRMAMSMLFSDKKHNFMTMCFGPYQDTYFGMLVLNKVLSNDSINEHCGQIFDHMICSNIITKESEKMIFLADGIDNHYHLVYIFRDKKLMESYHESHTDILELCKLCGKILIEQDESPIWLYCSSYRLQDSVKACDRQILDNIDEIIDAYQTSIQDAEEIDLDFGFNQQKS